MSSRPKRKNYCFACGPHNPDGFRLSFSYDPKEISASCTVRIDSRFQGATGYAHGGIIAVLLDEAMAKANGMGGIVAVTLRLDVSYKKMVPLRKKLQLRGQRYARRGRKLYLRSELRNGAGELLSEARGVFLELPPDVIARLRR